MLEGRLDLTATLTSDIYDCLACRGCESVCPSGVPVGSIMEDVRGLITERGTEGRLFRWTKRFLLDHVVARPSVLALLVWKLRLVELIGLRKLLRVFLPGALKAREGMLPPIPSAGERRKLPEHFPARGETRKRVGLFTGCIAAHLFPEVNRATARVLQRNGYEVVVTRSQGCCGALHLHNGLPEKGRELARRNVAAFRDAEVEAVVVNAAGCGAALSEYGELLADEAEARVFASRVVDISALLVREGFTPPRPPRPSAAVEPLAVAYDAPCHLFHAQKVKDEPRSLLSRIPGVTLLDFRDPERCCGSAGIYNVTHHEMSMRVLDRKMEHLGKTGADVIATGNPGCHLQLTEGVRRSGMDARVVHPVTLLDAAYRREPESSDS